MGHFCVIVACAKEALGRSIADAAKELDGIAVETATTPARARELLNSVLIDLLIVDASMTDWGADLVLWARHDYPNASVLVVTDAQLHDQDRAAIKLGVEGFIIQPVRPDHVRFQISQIREMRRLREEHARLTERSARATAFSGLIGSGSEMRKVFELVSRSAETDVPVALYGESGTGKELVARAIHSASPRRHAPFIAVNPASIPESLLESELFGHARGAFTGAVGEREGYFEAARGGTLFLDEVGELPAAIQVKLLRVLQERVVQRVGSSQSAPVDFRLVTATNRDLLADVKAGRFREDLFYRIHVFPIYLPALRNRRGDIPLLADHFLRRYTQQLGRTTGGFGPGVLETLSTHSWPGNVRELENLIYRLVAMKPAGSRIEIADLAGMVDVPQADAPAAPAGEIRPLTEHVRDYVRWAYERAGRNKARAARLLEIDRATLYRKLRARNGGRKP